MLELEVCAREKSVLKTTGYIKGSHCASLSIGKAIISQFRDSTG